MEEYGEKIIISKKIANIIIHSKDFLYTWLEGSAQSGKSVAAALAFSLLIEDSPKEDNLFIALGYNQSSAINNIFECGGLGLIHYFDGRCEMIKYKGPSGKLKTAINCLKIYTKNGTKIVVPFGTNTKTSNNAWHGWRIAGFLFDEIDRACQESIEEMQQRITAVKNPHIIVTQNPNVIKHPIYTFLKNLQDRNLVYYSHWVLDDNIGMSKEKIQEVKNRYDPTSLYYKRYINGERVNPEGSIYTIYDYNKISEVNLLDYRKWIVVCDQGETTSSSVFAVAGLTWNKEKNVPCVDIINVRSYLNKNKSGAQFKMPSDTAHDLAEFTIENMNNIRIPPEVVMIDTDEIFYRHCDKEFKENNIYNYTRLKYVFKEDINIRIKNVTSLIFQGKLRFLTPVCNDMIAELLNSTYDQKELEKGNLVRSKEYNEEGHEDFVDVIDYITSYFKNQLYT